MLARCEHWIGWSVNQVKSLSPSTFSPGTPVMAFVWALAALSYPELKNGL